MKYKYKSLEYSWNFDGSLYLGIRLLIEDAPLNPEITEKRLRYWKHLEYDIKSLQKKEIEALYKYTWRFFSHARE